MAEIKIDIHMPVEKGRFIVGEVIQRLADQRGEDKGDEVKTHFYVDANDDIPFPDDLEFNDLLPEGATAEEVKQIKSYLRERFGLIAGSRHHETRIEVNVRAAYKRNKMLGLGSSPYAYFADPDVLLPESNGSILAAMARGLERHPRLGAIGVPYQRGNHVATGSMMLRRIDLEKIGKIKGAAESCICNYIAKRLWSLGKFVVPLRTLRGQHLNFDRKQYENYEDLYPQFNGNAQAVLKQDGIDLQIMAGNVLQPDEVSKIAHDRFKLFIPSTGT